MIEVRQTPEFTKWFDGLKDRMAKKRIVAQLRKMELGNFGDVKPVGEGISETRLFYGPGYRLYFIKVGNQVVVLLCGGDKSTQSADIENAKRIRKALE